MYMMGKIILFIVSALLILSSCGEDTNTAQVETQEENRNFDSPGLLRLDENTSLTETGL